MSENEKCALHGIVSHIGCGVSNPPSSAGTVLTREEFQRLVRSGTYASRRLLFAYFDKAEARIAELEKALREQREWIGMVLGWKPRDMDATISAIEQMDEKARRALSPEGKE